MLTTDQTARNLITSRTRVLAHAIVEKQYQLQPGEWERFGDQHFSISLRDTMFHLQHLAEALALQSPRVLVEYVMWCQILFEHLHLPTDTMQKNLECTREVLQTHMDTSANSEYIEITRLNNELVDMHRELAKRNVELERLTANLETLVLERTQALTRSNEQLELELEERRKTEENLRTALQALQNSEEKYRSIVT